VWIVKSGVREPNIDQRERKRREGEESRRRNGEERREKGGGGNWSQNDSLSSICDYFCGNGI
jgi:hypothetical protein